MKRQTIAILTLGSFIVFSFSCYSVQLIKLDKLSSPDASELEIRKLDKTSGESIDFSKRDPGRVRGNFVEGIGTLKRAVDFVEVANADLQTVTRVFDEDEAFLSVFARDGKSYDGIKKIVKQGDKSVLYVVRDAPNKTSSFFKVSLSEMEKVWIMKFDMAKTFLAIIVIVPSICIYVLSLGLKSVRWGDQH